MFCPNSYKLWKCLPLAWSWPENDNEIKFIGCAYLSWVLQLWGSRAAIDSKHMLRPPSKLRKEASEWKQMQLHNRFTAVAFRNHQNDRQLLFDLNVCAVDQRQRGMNLRPTLMEETRVRISLIVLLLASWDTALIPGEIQSRVMKRRFVPRMLGRDRELHSSAVYSGKNN